jgi:hypothetical protein
LAGPQVRITPIAPQPDPGNKYAGLYGYTVESQTAVALQDVTLSLRAAGNASTDASRLTGAWTLAAPQPEADTVVYTAKTLPPGLMQTFQISVQGGMDLAVQLEFSATTVDGLRLCESSTIPADQAKQATPLMVGGTTCALAVREAQTHWHFAVGELTPPSRGLRWVLATGYINLWNRLHRAEEALIEVNPQPAVIRDALNDELRLMGSTIDNRDELLAELRSAVKALSPQAAATLLKLPPHDVGAGVTAKPDEARAALRHVNGTINSVRDDNWDGLVRIRNHLATAIFLTGLASYLLLALVISQPVRVPRETIAVVAGLYLIGAIVGLFNQLAADSQSDRAVEDYGLYLARLINIPLFSGLAGVFGVVLTVLLPIAANPTELPKTLPSLIQIFDLSLHPLNPIFAAVFGLTPNLLISRLSDQAAKLKGNINSTNAATHS